MSSEYSRIFGVKLVFSTELKNKETYDKLVEDGFLWIKQKHNSHFDRIVRFPIIGRWLLLSRGYDSGAVYINSREGQKLIHKLCYV
jgi:hypothetical protein